MVTTSLWLGLAFLAGTAQAAQGPSALRECSAASANRIEVGLCLEGKLARATAELSAVAAEVREQMAGLDAATGRPAAASAFDASQEAFTAFRERNCAWLAAQVGAGTGAGDVQRDCAIEMTRGRISELRVRLRSLPGAGAPGSRPGAAGPAGLTDVEWRLTGLLLDGEELAPLPGSAPGIRFDQAGTVQGNASINRFTRGYSADASGALRWSGMGLATTRMAGPPELMQQEDRFLEALDRAVRLRIAGDTLVLEDARRSAVLTFSRRERPPHQ
jgi:heat shock protein HslJ